MDRQFRLLGKILLATCLISSVRIWAATSLPVSSKRMLPERTELASNDRIRNRTSNRSRDTVSEKRKTRKIPYNYLLPFGVGQFERNKDMLGIGIAAGQAGFLLMYFDRLQQISTANNDAREVMRDFESSGKRSDPTILSFMNSNEAYVKKSAQESQVAMLGFLALYGFGVAEAIFNPFESMQFTPTKKRKEPRDKREATSFGRDTRIVQADTALPPTEMIRDTQILDSKVRLFYNPPSTKIPSSIGISFQKPL